MKCFNCGRENETFVCQSCRSSEVLGKLYYDVCFFKPDAENKNLNVEEYAAGLEGNQSVRDIVPNLCQIMITD